MPGPGNYSVENTGIQEVYINIYMIRMGDISCRSSNHRELGVSLRRLGGQYLLGVIIYVIFIEGTPAPGSYRLPSEFGYYEAAKKSVEPP